MKQDLCSNPPSQSITKYFNSIVTESCLMKSNAVTLMAIQFIHSIFLYLKILIVCITEKNSLNRFIHILKLIKRIIKRLKINVFWIAIYSFNRYFKDVDHVNHSLLIDDLFNSGFSVPLASWFQSFWIDTIRHTHYESMTILNIFCSYNRNNQS